MTPEAVRAVETAARAVHSPPSVHTGTAQVALANCPTVLSLTQPSSPMIIATAYYVLAYAIASPIHVECTLGHYSCCLLLGS